MHTLFKLSLFVGAISAASLPVRDVAPCGVNGYDLQNPAATRGDSSGTKNTFETCKEYCTGLASFAFGEASCFCYAATIQNNVNAAPASPYVFYNADCPAPGPATTTTTTTATTTSTTTTSTTPNPSPICGAKGYDLANPAAALVNTTPSTFTTCKAYCAGYGSFAFSPDQCICYAGPVAGNLNPVDASPFQFYDDNCPAPPVTTTTTTTTTTAPTTTTTTTTTTVTPTPTPAPCFQIQAKTSDKLQNGDWLNAPTKTGLTAFLSSQKHATTFSLNTKGQLVSTEAAAKKAALGRDKTLKENYGPVKTDSDSRYDLLQCTRQASTLTCATKPGDSTYTLGSLFYVGTKSSSLLKPVELVVVPVSCPSGWKA